jgi:hypothetical protein
MVPGAGKRRSRLATFRLAGGRARSVSQSNRSILTGNKKTQISELV